MNRPQLLFLSQKLAYPPDGGGKIRTFYTLRELARDFDITALCFARWKREHETRDFDSAVEGLSQFGDVTAIELPQSRSRVRFLFDHTRALASGRVYTRYVYASSHFRKTLAQLLATHQFDVVHSDSLDLSGYFELLSSYPLICAHHDVQSRLLARRAKHERSAIRRWYASLQASAMRKEEEQWCPRVNLNVVVSPEDRAAFEEIAPTGKYALFPNGVDIDYFQPGEGEGGGIVFVGGTSWFPNLDAWHHFGQDILPLLRKEDRSPTVTWVGRSTEEQRKHSDSHYGITMTGYVSDVRPYVLGADCIVVPIRVGGGTRIKILDAWAMGKAVVSTSVGCEGLNAQDGENILIRDEPREFAEAIRAVTSDPLLRKRLGENARDTVVTRYSWRSIGEDMRQRYHSLMTS